MLRGSPPIRPASILLLATTCAAACRPAPPPAAFTFGYWCWPVPGDRYAEPAGAPPPARLYVQVGRVTPAGRSEARWPAGLPRAATYRAVWRADAFAAPDPAVIDGLLHDYRRLQQDAAAAGQALGGLQLDVDCPTADLPNYASFLRALRARLAPGQELSITALLDWFRPGTAVAAVVAAVDEHVPQFYDAAPAGASLRIAEPIEAARWGAAFERLGRPYRLGLASFGRVLRARRGVGGAWERVSFPDLAPLDLAGARFEPVGSESNEAGEAVVRRRVPSPAPHPALAPGDVMEMVLPTGESLRRGLEAARAMGPRCAGVVIFRWPAAGEALVLTPGEVERARLGPQAAPRAPRLVARDGACAPRACTDLALAVGDRFHPGPLSVRLRSSAEVDYLLPARPGALAVTGRRGLAAAVPAYPGVELVALGRVFSREPARFSLEE